jgi:signal transduction histidine kinase
VELHDAFDVEYRRRVQDGRVRFVRSVAKPRYDEGGKFLGLLGCCVDATERVLAATTRPEPAPKSPLPLAGRSAEAMDIAFTITHDMQNPLATMAGQVALLRNAMKTGVDAEKHVERLQAGLDKLRGIVDSLMTVARDEQESLDPVTLNAEAVLRECVEQLRPLAEREGVLLATSTVPAAIYADRKAFERVVMNLLSNAVKFTALSASSRQVGVSLVCGRDAVRLEIADTGPGIPPGQLESVFRPFGRAEQRAPGTGLGLHSVRRYVEAFGGRVWLESDGRSGTKAVVVLPVRSAA